MQFVFHLLVFRSGAVSFENTDNIDCDLEPDDDSSDDRLDEEFQRLYVFAFYGPFNIYSKFHLYLIGKGQLDSLVNTHFCKLMRQYTLDNHVLS